jgi:hypothetical protein
MIDERDKADLLPMGDAKPDSRLSRQPVLHTGFTESAFVGKL